MTDANDSQLDVMRQRMRDLFGPAPVLSREEAERLLEEIDERERMIEKDEALPSGKD